MYVKSNLMENKIFRRQVFFYSHCITAKLVMNSRAHLRVIASAANTAPFEEILQRRLAVANTVSDLASPRFEPQT